MLKKTVIEKWVTALESGDYAQTTGTLHRVDVEKDPERVPGFCCLGVLCDLAVKEGVIPEGTPTDGGITRYGESEFSVGHVGALPNDVMKWAGLHDVDPAVDYEAWNYEKNESDTLTHDLSFLNDVEEFKFPLIAQIIRNNFLEDK